MKINYQFTPVYLDGSEITLPDGSPLVLSKVLANWIMNLAATRPEDITKYYNWANELYKTGTVDLDNAGRNEFRLLIESLQGVSVIVKVAILDRLKIE